MLRVLDCGDLATRHLEAARHVGRLEATQTIDVFQGRFGGSETSVLTSTRLVAFEDERALATLAMFADPKQVAMGGQARMTVLPTGVLLLPRLEYLDLSGCVALLALPMELKALRVLSTLNLYCCPRLRDADGIGGVASLQALYMQSCTSITRLPDLSALTRLHTLELDFCFALEELPAGMAALVSLRSLSLDECDALVAMPDLTGLATLRVESLPAALDAWEEGGRGAYRRVPAV